MVKKTLFDKKKIAFCIFLSIYVLHVKIQILTVTVLKSDKKSSQQEVSHRNAEVKYSQLKVNRFYFTSTCIENIATEKVKFLKDQDSFDK